MEIFSDFQCPFCKRVEPTVDQILQEYGGKVKIVWRNFPLPFHENAMPAAEAAQEVLAQGGVAKFWAYHDLLFSNQQTIDRAHLEQFAQQIGGIDMGVQERPRQPHPQGRHRLTRRSPTRRRSGTRFDQRLLRERRQAAVRQADQARPQRSNGKSGGGGRTRGWAHADSRGAW
jgi:predicted DsbA family dithiol-disulfide isomerase